MNAIGFQCYIGKVYDRNNLCGQVPQGEIRTHFWATVVVKTMEFALAFFIDFFLRIPLHLLTCGKILNGKADLLPFGKLYPWNRAPLLRGPLSAGFPLGKRRIFPFSSLEEILEARERAKNPEEKAILKRWCDERARRITLHDAGSSDIRLIRYLVDERGCRPDQCTLPLCNTIECMKDTESAEVIAFLLDRGAKVTEYNLTSLETPLFPAIRKKNRAVVELLLKRGASVTVRNSCRKTPVDLALEKGNENEEVIRALIEHPKARLELLKTEKGRQWVKNVRDKVVEAVFSIGKKTNKANSGTFPRDLCEMIAEYAVSPKEKCSKMKTGMHK